MFQNFEVPAERADHAERLARLRSFLQANGLDGLVVPHADEHQSEYLPPSARRLTWLTGFTGSAGTAVVLGGEAAIFVDGRYTIQAAAEVDGTAFTIENVPETSPSRWLAARVKAGQRVGYDPWLLTVGEARRLSEIVRQAGGEFVPVEGNPIDALWQGRPSSPLGPVSLHPVRFAGEEASEKMEKLRHLLAERRVDSGILTQADSIAWAFNIRGKDVEHNPVALSFAILRREGRPTLFIDGRKLSNTVRSALEDLADIAEISALGPALDALGRNGERVLVDPETAASEIEQRIRAAGGTVIEGSDPVTLPKARKNDAELGGTRRAHRRDGVAMVRFLAWFDREALKGGLDEIAAAAKLEEFRAKTAEEDGEALQDLSFDSISAAGPNSALPHYRVTRKTNRKIEQRSIYLIDSGAQYRDGTTDITRTIAVGRPTAEMRDRFTRVLKGHIAVATARFPKGASGAQIDGLARKPLWEAGLDFDHGTGHGVGAFLSVHEGPARISRRGDAAFEPGMILSDEPGYYREGAYGIRIENLLAVTPPAPIKGGEREMMGFETLTLAPIDRRLIAPKLLTGEERAWLDAYHARVRGELAPALGKADRRWLERATRPLVPKN